MTCRIECVRVMPYDYSTKMKFIVAQFKKIDGEDAKHALFALTTRYDGEPPYVEGKTYKLTIEEDQ